MSEARLTPDQRHTLREFTIDLACTRPDILDRGTRIADELRQAFPDLDDESTGAVLASAAYLARSYYQATGCSHVAALHRLLAAATADLAHLELDPPGRL